jgi:hypothetical protein
MNDVIDSSTWTGLSDDPYSVLGVRERREKLSFNASPAMLNRRYYMSITLILTGILMLAGWLQVYLYPESAASFRSPKLTPLLLPLCGLFLVGLGALACRHFKQRLLGSSSVAPLTIDNAEIRFGVPQSRIKLRSVNSVTLQAFRQSTLETARTLAVFLNDSRPWRQPPKIILLGIDGSAKPTKLDLEVLDDNPSRIGLIICDRVQRARSDFGTANA